MKIQAIEVVAYRLKLLGALTWGQHGKLEYAEHALIQVHLENGMIGTAEATPRPTIYGETIGSIQAILKHLEPRLTQLKITDSATISNVLASVPNNNCAKGALDMAIWEAKAQLEQTSVHALIGGTKTHLETSFILGIADQNTMLEEAKRVVAAGVRVLKVKVGRNTTHDLETILALRHEFGETVKLYADSNETLSAQTAAHALEQMQKAGLLYVEEPLPVRQIKARAQLKKDNILPIIADDSCFTPADLRRELEFDTFDILNIKSARNGFTDSLEMIQLANSAGKQIMIGSQASSTLGTIHAAILASRPEITHPNELSFPLKLETDITTRTAALENGFYDLQNALEIRIDQEKLATAKI